MISKLYIDKLIGMEPLVTIASLSDPDNGRTTPMDLFDCQDDLMDCNFFICSMDVLHQFRRLMPNVMQDNNPFERLCNGVEYLAYRLWYPKVKTVAFAPCRLLNEEYWAVCLGNETDTDKSIRVAENRRLEWDMNDIILAPRHMRGITCD